MEYENIYYDKFIESSDESWKVEIDGQYYLLPKSLCTIDDGSNVILCPLELIIDKELEMYIDN